MLNKDKTILNSKNLTKDIAASERREIFRLLTLLLLLAFSLILLSVKGIIYCLLIEVGRPPCGEFGVPPVIELFVTVDDDMTPKLIEIIIIIIIGYTIQIFVIN